MKFINRTENKGRIFDSFESLIFSDKLSGLNLIANFAIIESDKVESVIVENDKRNDEGGIRDKYSRIDDVPLFVDKYIDSEITSVRVRVTVDSMDITVGVNFVNSIISIVYPRDSKFDATEYCKRFLETQNLEKENDEQSVASESTVPSESIVRPNSDNALLFEEKLANVLEAIATLQESFNDKIAEDQHKNQLFDNMHRELTKYQNGLLDKVINTMAMDIIRFVDSVKKSLRIYEEKESNEENYGKLFKMVSGVAEDLDDVLYRQSIEPYTVPGDDVDARRQKIIQTVETDDETKDNKIAVRVAPGYEKDGKILRQEIIKIFKFKSKNNNNKGE